MPSVVAISGEWTPCGVGELKLYPTAHPVSVYVAPSTQVVYGPEVGHIVASADTETIISAKTTEKVWVRPLNAARVVVGITGGATGVPLREMSREFFCVEIEQPNGTGYPSGDWCPPPWRPTTCRVIGGSDYPNGGGDPFRWRRIEPTAGAYNWDSTNRYFSAVAAAGIDTVVIGWPITDVPYFRLSGGSYQDTNVAVSSGSPCVCTKVAHGLVSGQRIVFTTTGATLPSGGELVAGGDYYVSVINADTFNLSVNSNLSPLINTTGTAGNGAATVCLSGTPSSNFYKTEFLQRLLGQAQQVSKIKRVIIELPNEWYGRWQGTNAELLTECQQIAAAVRQYDDTITIFSMPVATIGRPYPAPPGGQAQLWDTLLAIPGFSTLPDEWAAHQYATIDVDEGNIALQDLDKFYALLARNGITDPKLNITEFSGESGSSNIGSRVMWLNQIILGQITRGVVRTFPYHWDGAPSTYTMHDGGPGGVAVLNAYGQAYYEMTKWWIGATIHDAPTGYTQLQEMNYSRVYAGEAVRGRAVVVGDASGATPEYPAPSWAKVARFVDGTSRAVQAGSTVTMGTSIVVFEG